MKRFRQRVAKYAPQLQYGIVILAAATVLLFTLLTPGPEGHESAFTPLIYFPVLAAVFLCRLEFACILSLLLSIAGVWLSERALMPDASSVEHAWRTMLVIERTIVINVVAILGGLYMRQNRAAQAALARQLKISESLLQSSLWMDAETSLEEAAEIALQTLQQQFPCRSAALFLREDAGGTLLLQALYDADGRNDRPIQFSLTPDSFLLSFRWLPTPTRSDNPWASVFPDAHSLAIVPIQHPYSEPDGVLFVAFGPDQQPSQSELLSLQRFASGMGLPLRRVRGQEKISAMAYSDAMTGLKNHRAFRIALEEEIRRAERYERPFALILLDIDKFKSINDTYGHPAGDTVLKNVAEVLRRSVRDVDTVARYGGEEFVVICPETDRISAELAAERIRVEIAKSAIVTEEKHTLSVTVSLGLAAYPNDAESEQSLLDRADAALYEAKRGGRNRVVSALPHAA